jgi:hypothetical protein
MTPISWWKVKLFLRYYIWRCNRNWKVYVIEGVNHKPLAILMSYDNYKCLLFDDGE